ncbi:MAG: 6-phosphofructokinase [Pseudobdellovibrionaceae bacterium]|nr:6-phosphofructokinase [Bdellovibrionales bacterium]USN46922.1 MAG: 6-phosphofructokinase [Pseudobdellovibrionaceae bacterium]
MRIGLMTGGGDAPGLNGIIEAVTKSAVADGHSVIGICDGFEGVFEGRTRELTLDDVEGLHAMAGTWLGTSNKCGTEGREQEFLEKYQALKLDGLIAAGGDGTFRGLDAFKSSIPIIGVPKTIDNDLPGTEVTFGYDTACSVVAEAVDALRATANAHRRIIFVETMGRTAGWIALGGGMASFSEVVLIPERPFSYGKLATHITGYLQRGRRGLVCVVSEGAHAEGESVHIAHRVAGSPEPERLGGIAESLARWVEKETGYEGRHVVLGHLQRSHAPTTTDRFLTLAMGVEVAAMIEERAWGKAVVYRQGRVMRAPISDVIGPPRLIDPEHLWVKRYLKTGGFI